MNLQLPMVLYFTRPAFLLLIPPLATAAVLVARGSYAGLSRSRWWAALVLRLVVVTLLACAVADLHAGKRNDRLTVMFVADTSRSVSAEQRRQQDSFLGQALGARPAVVQVGVLSAAGEAVLVSPPGSSDTPPAVPTAPRGGFTNLGQALRLAVAALPPIGCRRVVLLTDGNENEGDVCAEAMAARGAGVQVDTVPLEGGKARRPPETYVTRVAVAPVVREDEPVQVEVSLNSEAPTSATLSLVVGGRVISQPRVELAKGANRYTFSVPVHDAGLHEVTVLVEPDKDAVAENNRGAGFTLVRGKPKVLYAEGELAESSFLAEALRRQGLAVDVCGSGELPDSLLEMQRYDALILSDVPAPDLSAAQMRLLRSAVREGGMGLIMVGGHDSFAMGGYFDTPVEEALPVRMEVKHKQIAQRTAMVIAIDKSGSMGMIENGVAKYLLANEAACATARLLSPIDSLGVIATDSVARAVVPLQRLTDKDRVCQMIGTIRPGGGGIYCRVSLEMAAQMLAGAKTGARHVILLADGADSEQQEGCLTLAERLVAEGITVSCVAIGDGQDVPFLKQLSTTGKGRFYLTNLAAKLPRIFAKETALAMRTQLVEEPFQPVPTGQTALLTGLGQPPLLLGYVATTPKTLARVSLLSHKKDPVLATWQYGLGRTAAFTSSCKSDWGAHWVEWPEYGQFWSQLVRWVMRRTTPAQFETEVFWQGDQGKIVVEAATKEGRFRNFETFHATVATPTGEGHSMPLRQTAPGRYEATFARGDVGSYVVTVRGGAGGDETQWVGLSLPYAPDLRDLAPDASKAATVAALGGGKVLTRPEEAMRPGRNGTVSTTSVAEALLLWALAVFVLGVAVRRVALEPAAVWWRARELAARLRRRPLVQAHDESLSRLLSAKQSTSMPPPTAASSPREAPTGDVSPETTKPPPQQPTAEPPPDTSQEDGDTLSRLKRAKQEARKR